MDAFTPSGQIVADWVGAVLMRVQSSPSMELVFGSGQPGDYGNNPVFSSFPPNLLIGLRVSWSPGVCVGLGK